MNSFCSRLYNAAHPIWAQCLSHPFIRGIGDGSLPMENFRYYMLQDYLYLTEYARIFAIGAAKAQDLELMRRFTGSISTILNEEMRIHRAYMQRLEISEAQVLSAYRAQDNLSYTSYMLATAYTGTPAEIAAAILACSWSYAEIGEKLAGIPGASGHPFYSEWILGYSGAAYAASNQSLMTLMDRLAEGLPEAQLSRLEEIFVRCSRYELVFWDMAWEMRP